MANNQDLADMITSHIPLIANSAARAQHIKAEFEAGRLSHDEYKDLIDDISRLDNIDKEMFTIEVYREIVQALAYIATLKDLASFL